MSYKCITSGSAKYKIKRFNGILKSVTIKVDKDMNILNLEEVVNVICEGFKNFKRG